MSYLNDAKQVGLFVFMILLVTIKLLSVSVFVNVDDGIVLV